jgi:hypothetical protein
VPHPTALLHAPKELLPHTLTGGIKISAYVSTYETDRMKNTCCNPVAHNSELSTEAASEITVIFSTTSSV